MREGTRGDGILSAMMSQEVVYERKVGERVWPKELHGLALRTKQGVNVIVTSCSHVGILSRHSLGYNVLLLKLDSDFLISVEKRKQKSL